MAFQFKKLFQSFGYAMDGIKRGLQERNMKIHFTFLIAVIFFGFLFQLSATEWLIVISSSSLVISVEMINTAIEEICDLLNEKLELQFHHTTAPRDLSAAAVLVAALFSAVAGLIIYLPKFIALL